VLLLGTATNVTICDILIFCSIILLNVKSYDNVEAKCFMNSLKKIERGLTALAIAPLSGLEKKERDRRLEERLKRLDEKHSHK
jgi:hypothetical protein